LLIPIVRLREFRKWVVRVWARSRIAWMRASSLLREISCVGEGVLGCWGGELVFGDGIFGVMVEVGVAAFSLAHS
jgi:hypothetical protein